MEDLRREYGPHTAKGMFAGCGELERIRRRVSQLQAEHDHLVRLLQRYREL